MRPTAYAELDFPGAAAAHMPSNPDGKERLKATFADPLRLLIADTVAAVPGVLDEAESWARAGHWVVGFVAYEASPAFDPSLRVQAAPPDGMPFAQFAVFDSPHAAARARHDYLCGAWHDVTSRARFDAGVHDIRAGITAGDYYQVNYTTRLRAPLLGDSLAFFDHLRARQADAYCAYLELGKWRISSVSPELFFSWQHLPEEPGRRVLRCRPMKGTAARNLEPARDQAAATALRESPKERAENLMIVDLVRNDLSRVARPGSVKAEQLFAVEAWPTVWQMTSTVCCETREATRLRDVFGALFPCGSITGAPKGAAMSAIHALEPEPRGLYCGTIGVLMPGGEALFSVAIRTAVVDTEANVAECGIGSGITLGSIAESEYGEWSTKQRFLREASPEYELLETLRLHQGRYWLLPGHLRRLVHSAQVLGFDFDREHIEQALRQNAQRHGAGQWRTRLRLSADGTVGIDVLPLDPLPETARFELAEAAVASDNPWLRHKTTHRELYSALAKRDENIFDTLLYNEKGELTEFSRGNLVVERDGQLLTPHADCGLLPGVWRAALLARGRIREAILHPEDLAQAQQIWFINSLRGTVPVTSTLANDAMLQA